MRRKQLTLLLALSLPLTPARPAALAQVQAPAAGQQQPAETQTRPAAAVPQQRQATAPLDKRAEKVRRSIQKIGLSQTVTVIMPKEDDLHGTIIGIDEQSFQLAEVDLRQTISVRYADVKKVRRGYRPYPDLFTGQRNSPPRGARIAAFAGLIFAVALPLIIVASAKE